MADADQWCTRDHHRCTITHGWNRIPFDHRPFHHMLHGHAFVVTITDSPGERTDWNVNIPQQVELQHVDPLHEGMDYDEFEATSFREAAPSLEGSSSYDRPEEDIGIHIYRLDRPDRHCFLRWSSYSRLLLDITRCLQLQRNDIVGLHSLKVLPIGLRELHEKAVILQACDDIVPGSREQLILIDFEIHFHALPDGLLRPPAVSRRVYRILPPVHRTQILLLLGLLDYCELHGDHCTIYHDHQIWQLQDRTLHDLQHGSYIRVFGASSK